MAQQQKDHKNLIYGEEMYAALREGVEDIYKAVSTTYGPRGKNVLIEKSYGRPILTRDGVTVAREVYFKQRPKNMAAQLVSEASMTTNRIAGDGTTATVVLMRNIVKEGIKLVSSGHNPMELRDQLTKDTNILLDAIAHKSKPVVSGQLEQVATVSSGDPLLGKMISEAVEKVGENGGIITEKAHVSGVEREYVDGYYLQNGFTAITEGRKELENAFVVVAAKRISNPYDVLEILQKIVQGTGEARPRVAFIGEFEGDAYNTIIKNLMEGKLDSVVIGTPSTGDMGTQYLEDIAIYTGGKVIPEGDDIKQSFDISYVGRAKRIICTQSTASIFSDAGQEQEGQHESLQLEAKRAADNLATFKESDAHEDIQHVTILEEEVSRLNKELADLKQRLPSTRIHQLKDRLKVEESEFLAEKIRDRLAKLEGKIALFKIGGATETEKEEKEFRIEDAIQAARAAYANGVVPGGGTTLLRLSKEPVGPLMKNALVSTFKKLMQNANLPADVKVKEVLDSEEPMGINLRKGDGLVDLVKEGVLDPTLVVEQIITNAASNAGNALTIGCFDVFEDKEI